MLGVIRHRAWLDWLVDQKTDGRRQQPLAQILLRLGLYQIFQLDRVPDHAAVNETVNLARRHDLGNQAGFINAVLRNALGKSPSGSSAYGDCANASRRLAIPTRNGSCTAGNIVGRMTPMLCWNGTTSPPPFTLVAIPCAPRPRSLRRSGRRKSFVHSLRSPWLSHGLMYRIEADGSPAALASFAEGRFTFKIPAHWLPCKNSIRARGKHSRSMRRARRQDHRHRPAHAG